MTGNPFHSTANPKIASYSTPTDLGAKPAPYLKPINYDLWAELYWKKQLETLSIDKKIQTQIEKIKSHEWVKIIEGQK